MDLIDRILSPGVVWVTIPLAAILIWGIHQLVRMRQRHVERMAMIKRGMNPDALKDEDEA